MRKCIISSASLVNTNQPTNKDVFKEYLKKIGSGFETSKNLSREESEEAHHLMLTHQASAAQIGAFLIAHRMKRPEPQEIAGMIDTYLKLGPKVTSKAGQSPPICFGMPFDGRNRTAPIYPLTSLLLLSAKQPVVLHGGKRMPPKYGVTTEELFSTLGVKVQGIKIRQVEAGFQKHGFAFIYQPDHFSLAENLITYRDEIGKRPPIASMELIWTAHQGNHLLVSGFVHKPTEQRAIESLKIIGEKNVIFIKGLEGGIDLPISRPCITGHMQNNHFKRVILHPEQYKCKGQDAKWSTIDLWKKDALNALEGKGPLLKQLLWNGGTYFWFNGNAQNLEEGIEKAESYINSGAIQATLDKLIKWSMK